MLTDSLRQVDQRALPAGDANAARADLALLLDPTGHVCCGVDVAQLTGRLVVLLNLVKGGDGKFYITRQQDLYANQEIPGQMIFPPFGRDLVEIVKLFTGFGCALLAAFFQVIFRVWLPAPKMYAVQHHKH